MADGLKKKRNKLKTRKAKLKTKLKEMKKNKTFLRREKKKRMLAANFTSEEEQALSQVDPDFEAEKTSPFMVGNGTFYV